MLKTLKRLASALLVAALISASVFVMPAEAAGLAAPKNFHFIRWLNNSCTSCRIGWDLVPGANRYEVEIAYQNGTNKRYLQSTKSYMTIINLDATKVYRARVYAIKMSSSGSMLEYSNFSNTAYIVPSPTNLTLSLPDRAKARVRVHWNVVNWSNGYNVFLTTNPSGSWYVHKQTSLQNNTTVYLDKYRGAKFKKNVNYYYKIVSRSIQGGRYVSVPVPTGFYQGYFYLF